MVLSENVRNLQQSAYKVRSPRGVGSSFRVSDTKLVTANHVIEGLKKVQIMLENFSCEALVIHSDPSKDLAIIETTEKLPNSVILKISKTPIEITREVLVAGYPIATNILTIHKGQISAYGHARDFPLGKLPAHEENCSLIQIQSAINQGFSGGPVIEVESGDVIGYISTKFGLLREFYEMRQELREILQSNFTRELQEQEGPILGKVHFGRFCNFLIKNLEIISRTMNIIHVGIGYAVSSEYIYPIIE